MKQPLLFIINSVPLHPVLIYCPQDKTKTKKQHHCHEKCPFVNEEIQRCGTTPKQDKEIQTHPVVGEKSLLHVSYLIQSARKRAHLCAMLRPASKKHIRTISVSLIRVFTSRPSFPSLKLKSRQKGFWCWSSADMEPACVSPGWPAGPVGENPSQPTQDVQDKALSMLRSHAALCSPTQPIKQLLVEVLELQHGTSLNPGTQNEVTIFGLTGAAFKNSLDQNPAVKI